MPGRPRLLSPPEVVARWSGAVSVKTLRNWRHQRTGPDWHRLGGAVVYSTADLEEWERLHLPGVPIVDRTAPDGSLVAVTASGEALFFCPGCAECHGVDLRRWNLSFGARGPTIRPSIVSNGRTKAPRCHLLVTEGELLYCSDSEHSLAGEVVPMEPLV